MSLKDYPTSTLIAALMRRGEEFCSGHIGSRADTNIATTVPSLATSAARVLSEPAGLPTTSAEGHDMGEWLDESRA